MKRKYKYDQYRIGYKGNRYKIIVFPKINDIWCYDLHPAEPTYDISMSSIAAEELARAFAIVIADSQAIVYLPIKKEKVDEGIQFFNVVLTRHSINACTWRFFHSFFAMFDN